MAGSRPFNPLPPGSRDLLPGAFRRRRALTSALMSGFERWGYEPVGLPLIEYFEVFGRGLGEAERERCVRFIEAGSGDLVTLRSDVTPQIARTVAQRMTDALADGRPVRLCYAADVLRLPDRRAAAAEVHQAGIELLGDPDPAADAELIALTHEMLVRVGPPRVAIDLSHPGIVGAAVTRLGLAPRDARSLRAHLGRKDRGALAHELARLGVRGRGREAMLQLCGLHGPRAVLERARRALRPLAVDEPLDRLASILDLLEQDDPAACAAVVLDLGEARGFEYYTGIRMRIWAPGVSEPVGRGGRYDQMLARYGADHAAVGAAIDLDALERALAHAGRHAPSVAPTPACLVAVPARAGGSPPVRLAAAREARRLRVTGLRAWVEVVADEAAGKRRADAAGAERLVVLAGARAAARRWRRGRGGWRREAKR
jgi:ATP phosphoribosyltransferase regulatory subunit